MPCLEKVSFVPAHFAKHTPFYALWIYFSLFFYLDPQSEPKLFTNIFLSFKKIKRKNNWCSGLCPVLLLVRSVIWWGLDLIAEMTALNVNCLLSLWSSVWLLGLYQYVFVRWKKKDFFRGLSFVVWRLS